MGDFGVVTIATGKHEYLRMACALAASIRINSPGIPTCVITDKSNQGNSILRNHFDTVATVNDECQNGVLLKLYLDIYSPFDRTMFIDSDSLVFSDLSPVWDAFRSAGDFSLIEYGEPVTSAVTDYYATSRPEVSLNYFGLPSFPRLHSGVICFERGPNAQRVFDAARETLSHVERLGLKRFGSAAAADEPLFALALARLGLSGYRENERLRHLRVGISNDKGLLEANVVRGTIALVSADGIKFSPSILHFHFYAKNFVVYRRELFALLGVAGLRSRPAATVAALAEWAWLRTERASRRMRKRVRSTLGDIGRRLPRG